MSKARIQDLTDEQFEEWANRMVDEAGRRGIAIKGTDAIYWKRISKGNIGALIKLRQGIGRLNKNDVHIAQDIELTYSERANFSTLRQHGLVAHVKDDDGNRVSGRWLLTKRGAEFLRGEISIPQRVATMNNRVIDHDTVHVTITDVMQTLPVFDDVWDYRANTDTSAIHGKQQGLHL